MTPRTLLPTVSLEGLARVLRLATALYLGAPILIFAVGWLRPGVAAVAAVAVIVALAPVALGDRGTPSPTGRQGARAAPAALLAGLVPATVLVAVSGAGGFGPRTWDWAKHNAVLKDLIVQSWPVLYQTEAGTTGLVYYIAYHLPAAVAGAAAGWKVANLAILATSLTGTLLAVLWLIVLARGAPILCGIVFALFSGMDVLGKVLVPGADASIVAILANYHLEFWAEHWQYSSAPSLLYFVPNQAIAGWLLAALLIDAVRSNRAGFPLATLPAVALLWSPFVALGLLPLVLAAAFPRGRRLVDSLRAQAKFANIAAGTLGLLLLTYFAARTGPLALPGRYHATTAAAAEGAFWIVPLHVPIADFLVRYVLFVLCEFALLWLLALCALAADEDSRPLRRLVMTAGATLLVLPLFHLGLYNDLVMRASIPALFVLQVAAVVALRWGARRVVGALIAAALAIGAIYPANLLRWHLGLIAGARRIVVLAPMAAVRSLFHIQLNDPAAAGRPFVTQYLGAADAPFFRFLARRSVAVDATGPDPGADDGGPR